MAPRAGRCPAGSCSSDPSGRAGHRRYRTEPAPGPREPRSCRAGERPANVPPGRWPRGAVVHSGPIPTRGGRPPGRWSRALFEVRPRLHGSHRARCLSRLGDDGVLPPLPVARRRAWAGGPAGRLDTPLEGGSGGRRQSTGDPAGVHPPRPVRGAHGAGPPRVARRADAAGSRRPSAPLRPSDVASAPLVVRGCWGRPPGGGAHRRALGGGGVAGPAAEEFDHLVLREPGAGDGPARSDPVAVARVGGAATLPDRLPARDRAHRRRAVAAAR